MTRGTPGVPRKVHRFLHGGEPSPPVIRCPACGQGWVAPVGRPDRHRRDDHRRSVHRVRPLPAQQRSGRRPGHHRDPPGLRHHDPVRDGRSRRERGSGLRPPAHRAVDGRDRGDRHRPPASARSTSCSRATCSPSPNIRLSRTGTGSSTGYRSAAGTPCGTSCQPSSRTRPAPSICR